MASFIIIIILISFIMQNSVTLSSQFLIYKSVSTIQIISKENVLTSTSWHSQSKMYHLECFIRKFEKCINTKPPWRPNINIAISVVHWNRENENKSSKVNEKYCYYLLLSSFLFISCGCFRIGFTSKPHSHRKTHSPRNSEQLAI